MLLIHLWRNNDWPNLFKTLIVTCHIFHFTTDLVTTLLATWILFLFYVECTRWRLLQKRVMHTKNRYLRFCCLLIFFIWNMIKKWYDFNVSDIVNYQAFHTKWWFMVFNATFNNISVISWWSVLLVEETGGPGENHQPATSHWQTLSHNVVSSTPRHERCWNSQL